MKQLRVTRNGLELASVSLRQSISTLGRSPTCDGVLRAPGVHGLHFLLESQGAGANQWVLFDISDDSGEGVVLGSGKTEFKGFYFEISDALLDPVEQIGGGIQRSVGRVALVPDSSRIRLVECVRIRRDSGAVQEVSHLLVSQGVLSRKRKLRAFEDLPFIWIHSDSGKVRVEVRPSTENSQQLKIQKNSETIQVAQGRSVDLDFRDWIRMEYGPDDLYFRWVARVAPVTIPREVIGNPMLRWGAAIGTGLAVVVAAWTASKLQSPPEPVITQPPRVATIQIKEAPPPPPPQPIRESKPETQGKQESSDQKVAQGSEASAPKFARATAVKPTNKAGLNAPTKPKDVNQLGVLGALMASAPKSGAGVKADQIFNDSVVTQAVSGNSGSLTLKAAPSGALALQGSAGAPRAKGDGLQALATTLDGGGAYAPKDVGAIGRAGAHGKGLGSGLSGDGDAGGSGSSANALGSSDEGFGTEVQGGLDRETVRRVIASNRGKIRACYERALLSQPRLAGRVVTQFEISGKGPVLSAFIKASDVKSQLLDDCLQEVVRAMVFPASVSGAATRVIYPFVFQARNN